MAWNVQDLAQVTHLLISQLSAAIKASPRYVQNHFPFEVSGLMPAVSRTDGTNVLSLYLLHVGRDPYWRNTPVEGQRGQWNTSQPLSLNLSYLLTSYSEKNWHMEQYLMSVALSYFHANPIYKSGTAEFSVTVEADSIEEMSRLWQAITVPIRLSAMFRVAIVFLAPELPPVADMRTPVEVSLSVSPDLNFASPTPEPPPHLFEVAAQVAYRVDPNPVDPVPPFALIGQPGAAAGESVRLLGSGLDQANAASVYLSPAGGGAEWPLPPSWRAFGTAASGTTGDADEVVVQLPVTYGTLPASETALTDTPPPGAYKIAVGQAGVGFRSNALALSIAPQVNGIGPGLTVLEPDLSHVYSFSASGLVAGQTSVLIDQTALTIAGAVAPGVATVDAATGAITFELPAAGLTSGTYVPVRVIVNNVEAPPGWWVKVP
jgi:Pvc16 N-terminal domain